MTQPLLHHTTSESNASAVREYSRLRTGLGVDVHAFAPNRKLILGGVDIPHTQGLLGCAML